MTDARTDAPAAPASASPGWSRRSALRLASVGVAAPFLNLGAHRVFAADAPAYSTRAVDLVRGTLVIDMLAPLALEFGPEQFGRPLSDAKRAGFLSCGVTGFNHSVGIGGPGARQEVSDFFAAWSGFCGRNSDVFSLVGRVEDLERAKREGKVGVMMGVQDADHFSSPADVALFYALGQRSSQLTYNSQNMLGSGSTEREDGGLSDFGLEIVKAMNAAGMLVDVSHSGDRTTLDAIAASKGPIAITHSNCRALNDHPRLKTDEAIKALAAKGGVMGISGVRMFVKAKDPTTVDDIVDHIDHVRKLVGIEHVGIGSDSDLDGYDKMSPAANKALRAGYKASYAFRQKIDIDGYDHPRRVYDLTEAMIRRRFSDAEITAVLGGNFRRLLAATWI